MPEHLSCRQVVELVTGYFEQTLDRETYSLFEEHLNFCDGCEAYVDQMRATIAVVGRLGETDVPPVARERLMAAFRDWRGGGLPPKFFGPGGGAASPPVPRPPPPAGPGGGGGGAHR